MVCAKCQKITKPTSLVTPEVKKKSEMYYGSPAGSAKSSAKPSATLGNTGVSKVRLL
jgi:cysteine-rich PDZ-binding protein